MFSDGMECTQLFFQTTSDRGTLTKRRVTCELINALKHRDARTIRQTKRTVNIVSGEDHECVFVHQLRISKPRKLFYGESTQWVMECCRGSQKTDNTATRVGEKFSLLILFLLSGSLLTESLNDGVG